MAWWPQRRGRIGARTRRTGLGAPDAAEGLSHAPGRRTADRDAAGPAV